MDEDRFEGTLILEKLAERGKLDAFYAAIDSDNFAQVEKLMRQAGIDSETIAWVIKEITD